MALLTGLKSTGRPGVFYLEHDTRKNGVKKDRLLILRYMIAGKRRVETFAWTSSGKTEIDAEKKIAEFKENYRNGTGPISLSEETAIKEARDAAIVAEAKAAEAARVVADEAIRNRPTIAYLWGLYVESKPDLKGMTTDLNRFNNYILPTLGYKTPEEILSLDIKRLKKGAEKGTIGPAKKVKGADGKTTEVREPKTAQTVRNVLELLRRIINFAIKEKHVLPIEINYEMPKVDNQVTEHLTDAEVKRLLTALDEEKDKIAVAVVRLILVTGLRKGEALKLEWKDVDLNRSLITLRDPKGGKNQILPISAAAVEVLKTVPKVTPPEKNQPVAIEVKKEVKKLDFVFPGRNGQQRYDLKKPMDRIRTAAGFPEGFRPLHGLRHHFASTLASSGEVDLYTLQKLMTHKNPITTQRYAHLRAETMRSAADVASLALDRIAQAEEENTANNGEE